MKKYVICVHDNFGSISFDEVFTAKNANDALEQAMEIIDLDYGDIIRIEEVD